MKLSFTQKRWIQAYEDARASGGTWDAESQEYVPFQDIPVPEWYEDWITFLGSADVDEEEKVLHSEPQKIVAAEPSAEAKPSADWKEVFRAYGKQGGAKTRERGVEYYRAIGRLGGRGHKKIT